MPNKFFEILKLMRLNAPVGYLLVFYPACYGVILASNSIKELKFLILLFVGSITSRSAGCIINDLFDQDFDSQVSRTKNRPIANETINIKLALIILFSLLFISLLILLLLPRIAIYIGFLAGFMIIIYPLMKRITYFPQVFLGFTFNLGTLIGYATIKNAIAMEAIIMYLACCCWTIAYDTIYGFMDIKDDKKIGVKSMAIFLENKNHKFWLYFFYLAFMGLFFLTSYNTLNSNLSSFFLFCLVIAMCMLIWQVRTLNINDPFNCLARFKNNNYIGAVLALGLFSAKYL